MALTLTSIKQPIESEMQEFELRFREAMRSKVALLDRITYYIAHRKGKQMRPMFVLLSARMLGDINDATYTAASMVELLHTGTLVHDDVVDDSNKRRGFFSINALWKNKAAVLVGDYFLSKGLLIALESEQYKLLQILTDAIKQMSEGELQQMAKARKMDIEEDIYYEVIRKKTASFFAAACTAGAASVTHDDDTLQRVHHFGEMIGMAFQIKDDLFDYGQKKIGKPIGIDIKEKKLTLPLIYALQKSTRAEKRHIISLVKNQSHKQDKVHEVIQFAIDKGGLEYATERMHEYRNKAFESLYSFAANDARLALEQLIMFVTERSR